MIEDLPLIRNMILAVAAGYILGSLPFAHIASRIRGFDVFTTGSTLAGTANVFFNVGHRTGALVLVGDIAKGSAAVFVAWTLDVPPTLILVAGGSAVVGHWKSIFTRFRGGDGMAPLIGVTIALMPALAVLGGVVGLATLVIMRHSPLRSSWGISVSFLVMLAISQYYQIERDLVTGLVILASVVLLRSMFTRRRRLYIASLPVYRDLDDEDPLQHEDTVEIDPDADMGHAASGPR